MVIHHGALLFFSVSVFNQRAFLIKARKLWARHKPLEVFRLLGGSSSPVLLSLLCLKTGNSFPDDFPPIPKPTKLNTRRAVSKPLNTAPCLWLAKKRTSLRMY